MYDQPDDVEHMDTSEDDLHAEVDSWLENVTAGRCTGAYLAERFAEWQASRKVEVTEPDEVEWEYGIEDNVAEGGIEEGYSSEENALSVAAFSNHTYPASSGARAWAVKRVKAGPWIPVETAPERQE